MTISCGASVVVVAIGSLAQSGTGFSVGSVAVTGVISMSTLEDTTSGALVSSVTAVSAVLTLVGVQGLMTKLSCDWDISL
uniref:Uncharacterized protein n=1 Tax=Anopheles darlingi TaxID=43151 RepID=A0A2M4DJT8_ANODA